MKTISYYYSNLTIDGDPRITNIGYWLRKYHLDELPQLFNILIGDMSFTGPRPEIPEFIDVNNPIHIKIASVRPGLFDNATLQWIDEEEPDTHGM